MSARAGIVVTGTEVLSGIIADRNGPWLSGQLRERGVQLAHVVVVGDRPEDLRAALEFLARERMDVIITSGGLGPTADDLTAEVVAAFAGRELRLDEALEGRIAAILERLRARWRGGIDEEALRAGNRKQAMVPEGATVLEPVGTAPGLVVPADGVTVVVLPGPPGELQPMWAAALETEALQAALAGAGVYEQRIMRLFGPPESEIAKTLRDAQADGVSLDRLEITTCLRRGEIEIATVFEPAAAADYAAFEAAVLERHGATVFARDGETIDELVAAALLGPPLRTVAVAESCTGGLMAGRLTDRAGSSAYVLGGLTVYSNGAKVALAGVDAALIERHGAVSPEVAVALADGAIAAARARTSGSGSRASPGRAAAARPSRSAPSACRWPSAAGRGSTVPPAPGQPRDGARAHDDRRDAPAAAAARWAPRLSGSSSPSTCPRARGPRWRRSGTARTGRVAARRRRGAARDARLPRPPARGRVGAHRGGRARVRGSGGRPRARAGAAAAAAAGAGAVRGGRRRLGRARGAPGRLVGRARGGRAARARAAPVPAARHGGAAARGGALAALGAGSRTPSPSRSRGRP